MAIAATLLTCRRRRRAAAFRLTGAASSRAFVNLRGGTARQNGKREQCTAGVGTLLLEFGTLSRLSLDSRFEEAALCALRLLWSKRSTRDLLGNTRCDNGFVAQPEQWDRCGIDSFYEYALKSYLVFGDTELL